MLIEDRDKKGYFIGDCMTKSKLSVSLPGEYNKYNHKGLFSQLTRQQSMDVLGMGKESEIYYKCDKNSKYFVNLKMFILNLKVCFINW